MFQAAILREEDNSVLLIRVDIKRKRPKKGDRGLWPGTFSIPSDRLTALMGPMIRLQFDEGRSVPAIITEIDGRTVHFRAHGVPPRQAKRQRRLQTALEGSLTG